MKTRVCSSCKKELELNSLNFNRSSDATGFRYKCKKCKYIKSVRYKEANKERVKKDRDVTWMNGIDGVYCL